MAQRAESSGDTERQSMDDWVAFRADYVRRNARFVTGDGPAMAELWVNNDPTAICGAFGGYEVGAQAVKDRVLWAGAQFRNGTFTEELLSEWIGPDTALTLAIETIDAQVAGSETPVHQVLRVTQHYRKGPDGWRIAHRHADFLRPTSTDVPSPAS
jgi:hypothetical protein